MKTNGSLVGLVIIWLRSSRTDVIQTPCEQHCGQDQTHILECALHTSEKAAGGDERCFLSPGRNWLWCLILQNP